MADKFDKVARRMALTPFARQLLIVEAMQAQARMSPSVIEVDARTLETIPTAPKTKTQRLRMIDDAGLAYLNQQKAKRKVITAKRAEQYRRGMQGQRK